MAVIKSVLRHANTILLKLTPAVFTSLIYCKNVYNSVCAQTSYNF